MSEVAILIRWMHNQRHMSRMMVFREMRFRMMFSVMHQTLMNRAMPMMHMASVNRMFYFM
jgi:hypothetical protein